VLDHFDDHARQLDAGGRGGALQEADEAVVAAERRGVHVHAQAERGGEGGGAAERGGDAGAVDQRLFALQAHVLEQHVRRLEVRAARSAR
jgi:hypothetical protein